MCNNMMMMHMRAPNPDYSFIECCTMTLCSCVFGLIEDVFLHAMTEVINTHLHNPFLHPSIHPVTI